MSLGEHGVTQSPGEDKHSDDETGVYGEDTACTKARVIAGIHRLLGQQAKLIAQAREPVASENVQIQEEQKQDRIELQKCREDVSRLQHEVLNLYPSLCMPISMSACLRWSFDDCWFYSLYFGTRWSFDDCWFYSLYFGTEIVVAFPTCELK